jgi:hypothetical protein
MSFGFKGVNREQQIIFRGCETDAPGGESNMDSNPESQYYEMDAGIWQTLSWSSTVVKLGRRRELRRAVRLAVAANPAAPTITSFYSSFASVDKR